MIENTSEIDNNHNHHHPSDLPDEEREANTTNNTNRNSYMMTVKKFTALVFFLFFFLFLIFPLLPLFISVIFGALFVLCEPHTSFKEGFLYVVSNLFGDSSLNYVGYVPEKLGVSILLDMYVAITALVLFGIMLNIVNLFGVPDELNNMIERYITKNAVAVPLIALCLVIPIWNAVLSVIFGSILAKLEEWSIRDGILYVFSNTLGLGSSLTSVSPENITGAIVDIIISSMALGYIAIFADYVTTLNPSSGVRKWMRKYLVSLGIIDVEKAPEYYPMADFGNKNNQNKDSVSEGKNDVSHLKMCKNT